MDFNITSDKVHTAVKTVIYGAEGIGKTTLAAQFPSPLFIDTEGSTKQLDVARLPAPSSWEMLLQELDFVRDKRPCATLVIDTVDWAEQLCIADLCAKNGKSGTYIGFSLSLRSGGSSRATAYARRLLPLS